MADMIVEYRVMPEDGEVEFTDLEKAVVDKVTSYKDDVKVLETNEESVGFGLKAVKIKFRLDENHGSETLENELSELDIVGEVTVTFMDRL